MNPDGYDNYGTIKKGKIFAVIGMILNIKVIGVTVWTLSTIVWDAWSEEFVKKWNEGMQSGQVINLVTIAVCYEMPVFQ